MANRLVRTISVFMVNLDGDTPVRRAGVPSNSIARSEIEAQNSSPERRRMRTVSPST